MELGAALLTFIDTSAKVASVLFQYASEVKNAKDDIWRLQREFGGIHSISKNVQTLLRSPRGCELRASRELLLALNDGFLELEQLQQMTEPKKAQAAMKLFGARSLKWPLTSKDVEKAVRELVRCMQAISLALQVDHTYVLWYIGTVTS